MRKPIHLLSILALLALAVCIGTWSAYGRGEKTLPPGSHAYGKTLTEWMLTYWKWLYTGEGSGMVGNVMLLPLPTNGVLTGGDGTYASPATYVGSLDLTMKPGTPFVLPVVAWLGERYNGPGGCECPPDVPLPESATTAGPITVTLDGQTLIQGMDKTGNVSDYYYGPAPLVIDYDSATYYGSTGIIFAQGVGFVHGPLTPGTHVLKLDAYLRAGAEYLNGCLGDIYAKGSGYHYINTWTIKVVPPGKR